MKIKQLRIDGWKGLGQVKLELAPGLNLIHGPNESGKTSLREAIRCVLLEPPTKRGKSGMQNARPWGTSVNPLVEIAFDFAGLEYELSKRFLARTGSWLKCDGKLVAQDEGLQEKLDALLPLEGLASLWAVQGDTALPAVPVSMRSQLASLEAVTPGVSWLEATLKDEMDRWWTDKRASPNSAYKAVRERTLQSESRVTEHESELEDCNRLSEQIQCLSQDVASLEQEASTLQERLDRDQEALGAWDLYEREVQTCNAREQEKKALESWQAGWARNVASLRELETSRADYEVRLQALRERSGERPTRARVDELQQRQASLQGRVRSLLTRELEELSPPSKEELTKLGKLESSIAGQEAALDSGAASVTLTAETPLAPRAVLDGEPQEGSLAPGASQSYKVLSALSLELPGVARLRVESANQESKWQALALQKEELTRLLAVLRVGSAQEAEERYQRAQELNARLKTFKAIEPVEPEGGDRLDELERELAAMPAALEQAEKDYAQADQRYRSCQSELETLLRDDPESRWKTVHDLLLSQAAERPELGLKAPFPEKPLEEPIARLTRDLDEKRAALTPPSGTPVTREGLAALRARLETVRSDRERVAGEMQQKIGAVGRYKGLYEKLAVAQEEYARAFQEERQTELEAQAARLLREALTQAKADLQDDLVGPLQTRLSRRLVELTSARYQGVLLKGDFQPQSVVAAYTTHRPEVAELSFGTREQLSFLARVCLAELLSERGESQVLLLDDSLVHTDDERMERACSLLKEVSGRLQVLLFTCHPERFRSLETVSRVHRL